MGDVIEISPFQELEPNVIYCPSRCKHDPLPLPDGNESAIEPADPTDNHSSTLYERAKRRKEAVETSASPLLGAPVALTQVVRCGSIPHIRFSLY